MKQVRALQECFVEGGRRKVGAVFNVPNDQPLRTGRRPPVMELIDEEPGQTKAKKKRSKGKRKAAAAVEPAED